MCPLCQANVSAFWSDVSCSWPDVSAFQPNVSTLAGEVSIGEGERAEGRGVRVGVGGWGSGVEGRRDPLSTSSGQASASSRRTIGQALRQAKDRHLAGGGGGLGLEDDVGDSFCSSNGFLRLWDVGFRKTRAKRSERGGGGAPGMSAWTGWQVAPGSIGALGPGRRRRDDGSVDEAEGDAVSDEVALQVLFGALLGEVAGQGRQRTVRP